MTIIEAKRLFEYDAWANARMFDAAEALAPGQVAAAAESSFPSIGATLGHLAGAEWIWLRRWLGDVPAGMPDWAAGSSLAEIRRRLAEIEAERAAWLAGLTDADIEGTISYRTSNGKSHPNLLSDLIRHLINHSTYHRGQAATQFRRLGQSPPSTDYIRFLREATGQG